MSCGVLSTFDREDVLKPNELWQNSSRKLCLSHKYWDSIGRATVLKTNEFVPIVSFASSLR